MADLAAKVAIITGASRGIGRAIAERLAADAASVVINYSHSADQAKELVSTLPFWLARRRAGSRDSTFKANGGASF